MNDVYSIIKCMKEFSTTPFLFFLCVLQRKNFGKSNSTLQISRLYHFLKRLWTYKTPNFCFKNSLDLI